MAFQVQSPQSLQVSLQLQDAAATEALAHTLALHAPTRAMVWLEGQLGAGKSTWVRALLRHLGVTGTIRSPTYTLVERYATLQGMALHLDLYRIADGSEMDALGLDDIEEALCLVEWPDHAARALPAPDVRVRLQHQAIGRACTLVAMSEHGLDWLVRSGLTMPNLKPGATHAHQALNLPQHDA